jgi:hypothetical protein
MAFQVTASGIRVSAAASSGVSLRGSLGGSDGFGIDLADAQAFAFGSGVKRRDTGSE